MWYFLRVRCWVPFLCACLLIIVASQSVQAAWVRAGTHAGAASQKTVIGRTIVELEKVGNRIYTGYGDYGLNTGPIQIHAYNLRTRRLSYQGLTLQTEAILKYRQSHRRVFAIGADLHGSSPHQFAVRSKLWTTRNNIDVTSGSPRAEHIYDVVTWRKELWAAGGMADRNAGLWRSKDNGASWTLERSVAPSRNLGRDVSRFYFIAIYRDQLYVQAVDFCRSFSCPKKNSLVYDGKRWRNGPDLLMGRGTGYPADRFAGRMILRNFENSYYPHNLHVFDGKTITRAVPNEETIHDYTISEDGYLYVLTTHTLREGGVQSQKILRTRNLKEWSCVFLAPANGMARSIEVAPSRTDEGFGTVFLGTIFSTIVKRDIDGQARCPRVSGDYPDS